MSKTKKPSKAQIEVLKKMNEENLIILYNNYSYKSAEFYRPNIMAKDGINFNIFKGLKHSPFIEQIAHENQSNYNAFYQITEQGKQAINGKS